MDNNEYAIVGRIVARDATSPGTTSATKGLQAVEDKARSVGWNIQGFLGRAFAVMGGGAIVGGAVRGMIGLNTEIESAQSALTGLFMSQTGASLKQAFQVSRQELRGLRADAAAGVGELSNYMGTYQAAASVGLPLGASLTDLRELTRNAIAAGDIYRPGGEGMQLAGLDIQQALTGQVGDRTTPIVMAALRASGTSAEAFRALRPEERINALNTAFAVYAPAVEMMGRTWSAQMSTLQDNTKELIRTVTAPLFASWTDSLRRANEWIKEHRGELTSIAEVWGARILRIWDHVISHARTYLGLLVAAAAVQAAPTVIGAARGAGGALGRAGAGVRGLLSDPFGFASVFAGVGGGANAVAGPGMIAALRGALAGFSRLAGPVALVAVAATSAYGALAEFPSLLAFLADSGRYVIESFSGLADAFGTLTQSGSALNYVGAALVATFGGLGYVIGGVVRVIGSLAIGLGVIFGILGEGMGIVYGAINGNGSAVVNGTDRMAALLVNAQDQLGQLWLGGANSGVQGEQTGKIADLPTKKGGDNITNINGPMTFQLRTEINADPARVMVAWEEGADTLTRFRTSARRSDDV